MNRKIVAGNWKMNTSLAEAKELTERIISRCSDAQVQVILAPPFPFITEVVRLTKNYNHINVAAQNCSHHTSGAFTGEVSGQMVASTGADAVIIGHSERRQYFKEDEAVLSEKINQALTNGLNPVYCVGESREQRETGQFKEIIENQVVKALFHLSEAEMRNVILAYEPVWAIGTGLTATPEQAEEVHAFIRNLIAEQYGSEVALNLPILYGGSCKPDNAAQLFAKTNIDGGLIGGASLVAEDFCAIVKDCEKS